MASLTVTIPDNIANRVNNAFAKAYGYQANIPDPNDHTKTIPNPETKVQFMKRQVTRFMKETVKSAEVNDARETAGTTASNTAESEIIFN